tara:strand:- start:4269 stop:6083 length:1815 start_codon:yes stop_codon:yes gene_type:complete
MPSRKAQLVSPLSGEYLSVPGISVTGVITATGGITGVVGVAQSIADGADLDLGTVTGTTFVGDSIGTYRAAGLTNTGAGTSNLNVGVVTATSISGVVTGNITGTASSIISGANLTVGVATAVTWLGDGSGLTGAGSSAFIGQAVTAQAGTTTIDLSSGNIINFTHSNNTTVAFANTSTASRITFIRNATANTITWPDRIKWNNGSTPTLFEKNGGYQVFRLTTVDAGTTYQAWEESASPDGYGMFVYGYSNSGRLGLNDNVYRSSPTQVGTSFDFTGLWQVTFGGNSSTFQKNTNDLFVAGYNGTGQLGQNDRTSYSSPRQIPGVWTQATLGENSMRGHKGGSTYVWGSNNYGQLGLNDRNNRSSPVLIPGSWDSSAGKDCIGNSTTFAIKTNGTLWSWGRNFLGILGQNQGTPSPGSPGSKSSPTQVGTDTTWLQMLHADTTATAAIKNNGTLWAWGYANPGMLGQNNVIDRSSPTQVGTDTNWSRSFMLNNCCVASKTNGTLWAWGNNGSGRLGQNNLTNYSSPTQIGTDTTWTHGSLEGSWNGGGFCKKTDGTLWCWGLNSSGQLGLNSTVNYSSPVQVTAYSDAWLKYGRMGGSANAIIK